MADPSIIERLRPAPERPRVNYHREFAWRPVHCADDGLIWLRWVWRVTSNEGSFYTRAILPLGGIDERWNFAGRS